MRSPPARVAVIFSDGSVVKRYGRVFSSCGVYTTLGSSHNQAKYLPQVRSSYCAELEGVHLGLDLCFRETYPDVLLCLGMYLSFNCQNQVQLQLTWVEITIFIFVSDSRLK